MALFLLGLLATGISAASGAWSLLPFAVYLVGAIVLAVRPVTSRFGAGLLLAIGVWVLIGAGVCVALLNNPRGFV
ncbi:hypothetical protein [Sinomonas sp. ASV322]|uniref:hypothetical protein n=1 Tax=Sinomonas sp. ASV322 TaxID=3041920 RepID=UPI0027DAD708|nr:hypothetical protein [Sinomonas sp. ASV322]MDQ4503307.1 hypothetical protein [Sinomonas sp. ASV322]